MRARRWTSALIVAELALTLVLLAGAGLMMRSFLNLYRLDVGIETSQLLTMRLNLPNQKYPTPEQRRDLLRPARSAARRPRRHSGRHDHDEHAARRRLPAPAVDGRQGAGGGRTAADGDAGHDRSALLRDARHQGARAAARSTSSTAPRATTAPSSISGSRRCISARDDPIGRRIKLTVDGPQSPGAPPPVWMTIVGIAPTVRQRMQPGDDVPDPVAYIPLRAHAPSFMMLLIRAQRDAASLTSLAREEVRAIDPDLPLFGILTMDQQLAQQRWPFRIFGTMFAIFAFIALALSAVGLYAVTAYSVAQRTQEIGVRMALGAQAAQVMWLILRRSLVQMAIGLTIGIAGALGVGKLLSSLLFQTGARDPVLMLGDRLAADRRVDVGVSLAGAARDAAGSGQRAAERLSIGSVRLQPDQVRAKGGHYTTRLDADGRSRPAGCDRRRRGRRDSSCRCRPC